MPLRLATCACPNWYVYMKDNPLWRANELGQSVWLDDLSQGLLASGELRNLIRQDHVSGVTTNPSIFRAALLDPAYASRLDQARGPRVPSELYEQLVIDHVRSAADELRETYDATAHYDGFVSVELTPRVAHDATATIAEAERLWQRVARPNVMIKIPATAETRSAVRHLVRKGVPVNVTLVFGLRRHQEVLNTFADALTDCVRAHESAAGLTCVISFFISRLDAAIDPELGRRGATKLVGLAAIAIARSAYHQWIDFAASPRWQSLAAQGARPPRLVWASMSPKDPAYDPLKYVDALVMPGTIATLPLQTLTAFRRMGRPSLPLADDRCQTRDVRNALQVAGIDLEEVAAKLEEDGLQKFAQAYDTTISGIDTHLRTVSLH